MASYSVFIGLKDAGGSFVPNADAIALFLCSGYQPPSNENTVIVSDMSQSYTSTEYTAHLVLAFRDSNAQVTSTFDEYGFNSEEPSEYSEILPYIKQLDLASLPGYNSEMGQEGVNVSGGQKQRICIARAILKKPKVLILDDSTSAVDTATEARIRERLSKKLPDMTKIVIAQRISSVRRADQIIILDKGSVNAIGTHESLLRTNKIYQEIYESQKEGADL